LLKELKIRGIIMETTILIAIIIGWIVAIGGLLVLHFAPKKKRE